MSQSDDALTQLTLAKQLTEQMVDAARVLQWERVMELEIARRSILDQVFATDAINGDVATARVLIASMVELNEEVARLATAGAESFAAELKALRQSRSAAKAYDTCGKTQLR